MTTAKRRIDKLETGLTPKQIILLWFQEAHAFNSIEEYVRHLKTQPDSAADLTPENSNSGKESPPGKIGHSKEGSWHGRGTQRSRS